MGKVTSAMAVILLVIYLAPEAVSPASAKEKGAKAKGRVTDQGGGPRVKIDYRGGGPPPWAPAHGYRRSGRDGQAVPVYAAPFQIDVGRCNRGTLGAVLGGAAGGALGSRVGGGTGRDTAIVGGTILGVLVGQSIGRWMDEVDQACVGQVLEHAGTKQSVEWVNPDNGVIYQVAPAETWRVAEDRYCREFEATAQIGGRTERTHGTACRRADGSWERADR